MTKPSVLDMERVKRIGRYFAGKPRAKCWFRWQQCGELSAYSDADWGGDKATRRSVSAGLIMRGGHSASRCGPRSSKWCHCPSPRASCTPQSNRHQNGLGSRAWQKTWEISCRLNLHLDASATMCLVNRRGMDKAKHVDMQDLWILEASKSGKFVTKKVGTSVNPADFMTKPLPKPKIEKLMNLTGYEFMKSGADVLMCRLART